MMKHKHPPDFWYGLPIDELYRHQAAVALHMAEARNLEEKAFFARVFMDIGCAIVTRNLGVKISSHPSL